MKQIDEMTHEEVKRFAEMMFHEEDPRECERPRIQAFIEEKPFAGWTRRKEALLDLFWRMEKEREEEMPKGVTDIEIIGIRRMITIPGTVLRPADLCDATSKLLRALDEKSRKPSCKHVVPMMSKMESTDYFGVKCEFKCPKCKQLFAIHQRDFSESGRLICPFGCLVEEK